MRLGLAGSASIPARDFDLRGVAALVAATAADAPPAFELPFVVQGPWDDPILLPDTQSLISRSPAAAPAARRGAKPQHPRHRALGHRAADRRRRQPSRRRPTPATKP